MSEYERTLDYELELIRSLDDSTEEEGEDRAVWRAFNEAYSVALRQLVTTMAPEHAEMVLSELDYRQKHLKEMDQLIAEGKAYGSYSRYAKYPGRILSELARKVHQMCLRHALGDERPLALPSEVAQIYLCKGGDGVLRSEFECADCGVDIPYLYTPARWDNPDKFARCPVCSSCLEWWPDKQRENEAWSKSNPEKSVSVYVWPNGSVSYNDQLLGRFKGQG